MDKCKKLCNKLAVVTILACSSSIVQAATAVSDDFDAGLGSWIANTSETTNTHQVAGGNPGGYLHTDNTGSFGAMGASNLGSDYTGVFADGVWNIMVDLAFINGDFSDAWLRFRFQDSTANGWHISLEDTDFFAAPWQSYSVTFNTTWDDATAMANGWVKESDGSTATPSFSGLWDDVYTSEVRILASRGSVAGIDNYKASVVPVPAAVWLFGSGLMGLIGLARRNAQLLL